MGLPALQPVNPPYSVVPVCFGVAIVMDLVDVHVQVRMLAKQPRSDVLANNLANVNTTTMAGLVDNAGRRLQSA